MGLCKNKLMSKTITIILICGLLLSTVLASAQTEKESSTRFTTSLMTGYNGGFGVQGNLMLGNFADDFPFDFRLGFGYSIFNPGIAADARRIFINNATNGVPEKAGSAFDYRLDFLLQKSIFRVKSSYLVFGPRYSSFKGNFKFIGGNEDFDVISRQWGLGTGIENHFKVTERIGIVFNVGMDYYFPNTLKGHDTSYSPDNDNINPRDDNENGDVEFTYKDADKAINQPRFILRAMFGISFRL